MLINKSVSLSIIVSWPNIVPSLPNYLETTQKCQENENGKKSATKFCRLLIVQNQLSPFSSLQCSFSPLCRNFSTPTSSSPIVSHQRINCHNHRPHHSALWQNKYSQTKPKVFALCLLLVLPLFAFAFVGVFHFTFQLEQEEYVVKTYQYKITNCHISRKLPKIDISAGACWGFCSFFVCFKTRL